MKVGLNKRNRGQGLLEFALVLPFLMVVVFGVFDLGRIYFTSIMLTSAAREGARYLSVYPGDVNEGFAETKEVAYQEARNSGILLEMEQIFPTCSHILDPDYCDSGTPAEVTVTTDFDLILGWLLPPSVSITRSAEMVVP